CLGTGMTPKGLLLFWMETSVSYFHDTLTSSSRYVLAAKRYRGGMTVCGGMTVRGGMTVKQFVIPLLVSG
ncbi:MAG: hypothetical protein ACEY3B_01300, partial [Wolbachia sp.]